MSKPSVGIDLLEPDPQLIRIEPFRAPAELTALELSDDETKLLDLALPLLPTCREIVHELMKLCRIGRQIRRVETHE